MRKQRQSRVVVRCITSSILCTIFMVLLPIVTLPLVQCAITSPTSSSTIVTGHGSRNKRRKVTKKPYSSQQTQNMPMRVQTQTTPDGTLQLLVQTNTNYTNNNNNTNNNVTLQLSISKDGAVLATFPTSHTQLSLEEAWISVDGIYGVVAVPSGLIWVLLTSSDAVYKGPPWGEIRKVTSMDLVHLPYPIHHLQQQLSPRQIKEEARQLKLLRQAWKEHVFYFLPSNDSSMDMTQSLQRMAQNHHRDSRFYWNEPHTQLLQNHSNPAYDVLRSMIIPLTSAFVGVQSNQTLNIQQQQQHGINNNNNNNNNNHTISYDELLISRRSRFRAGTRFTKRGADGTGHVANYAETEQVCLLRQQQQQMESPKTTWISSHVQTRGSIPLRWSSPADVKTYAPRVRIGTDPLSQARGMMKHVLLEWNYYYCDHETQLNQHHPQLLFVNLIDKKKDQGRLGRAFDAVLQAVLEVYSQVNVTHLDHFHIPPNAVQHIWFDFHAEVKHGKWDTLASLLTQVKPTLDEQGYFSASFHGTNQWTILSQQRGVVRTNCMDCLDRTNVVQSIFGRYMLFRSLSNQTIGSKKLLPVAFSAEFRKNAMTLPWGVGEVSHRLLWADNADAISRLYAGTPALKGDFTRTGKRTKRGALDDGMNSLQRYYLNNFLDADRQEGMDLMVGYADFAIVNDDDPFDERQSVSVNNYPGMSLSNAARELLTVNDDYSEPMVDNVGDYIPIPPGRSVHSRLRPIIGGGAIPGQQQDLDLRWISGDLQSHIKSQSTTHDSKCSALEALDRRSGTDQPWWVLSVDSEDDEPSESHSRGSSSATAGHMIGGLLAVTQAPIASAIAVVCMLGLSTLERKGL